MRARLTRRLDRDRSRARLIDAPAEQLPFADHSIDTVVSSFVLCTVTAPDLALREIARVLRHDGQLLFIEHVRSDSPTLARWQDRLDKPWRCFARGCRCNRATAQLIVACGFELATLRVATWRAMPPIVRPLVIGRAQPRTNGTAETGSPVDRALSATGTGGRAMTSHVHVGLFPAALHLDGGPEPDAILRRLGDADVDHLCVGDHVSFFVGAGSDGLITAASLLAAQAELPVYVGLYLLPLRHPVLVARQLATLTELAPGRLTLGVGVGGEDRHELEICGVDPTTRGRRMDESLRILRALADGNPLSFDGEFFTLHDALITPALTPRIPLIVGGRSPAAARRAATLGDGWLGIWVSPRRYATTLDHIAQQAAQAGRDPNGFQHALNVWCGFGPTVKPPEQRWQPGCRPSTRCRSSHSSATPPTAHQPRSQSSSARTSKPAARRSTSSPAPTTPMTPLPPSASSERGSQRPTAAPPFRDAATSRHHPDGRERHRADRR